MKKLHIFLLALVIGSRILILSCISPLDMDKRVSPPNWREHKVLEISGKMVKTHIKDVYGERTQWFNLEKSLWKEIQGG